MRPASKLGVGPIVATLSGEELKNLASLTPLPSKPPMVTGDVLALVADSVVCADEEGHILFFNRAAEKAFGYKAFEVIGRPVEMLLPQHHHADHAIQVRSYAFRPGAASRLMGRQREVCGRRKNGEEFPAEAAVSRETVNGSTVLTVVVRDITQRKELEEQREAIANELDHRIKNVLSVVNSLVSLTARSAVNVPEFKEALIKRLGALARTQDALRSRTQLSAPLSDLLDAELEQYRAPDGANIIIEGPAVSVGSGATQTLALAFHELATNSAKYGALSHAKGRVTVTFAYKGEGKESQLVIEWRDSDGPLVKPPTRQGFGTTFIKQVIARTFRADVVLEYPPEGLICRMTLPRTRVEAMAKAKGLT
jgi:PAS domain S-box-containing protein